MNGQTSYEPIQPELESELQDSETDFHHDVYEVTFATKAGELDEMDFYDTRSAAEFVEQLPLGDFEFKAANHYRKGEFMGPLVYRGKTYAD